MYSNYSNRGSPPAKVDNSATVEGGARCGRVGRGDDLARVSRTDNHGTEDQAEGAGGAGSRAEMPHLYGGYWFMVNHISHLSFTEVVLWCSLSYRVMF